MKPLENYVAFATTLGVIAVAGLGCSSSGDDAPGGASNSGGAAGVSSGGQSSGGVSSGGAGAPAATAGTAGLTSSGGAMSAGGAASGGGGAGSPTLGCSVGGWPAADPSKAGPYETVTENEVGPQAGEADEETGVVPKFTLFRPKELSPDGRCHPVITWGNGTGSTPNSYRSLLQLFASHGFVVIGSNSKNVARGEPKPMLVGVTWVLEQNQDPTSALYHHLDPAHIGATGHSQGAMATSQASGDERIYTSVPIEGAMTQRNLHGPAMFFCGTLDEIVGCDGAASALKAVTTLPALYAENLAVDHGSWMSFGNKPSPTYAAINAWMRVHLMADDALKPWFYGGSCQLCADAGWKIEQKNMTP